MNEPPLVVDLDGSLLRSDLLVEGMFALAAAQPLALLSALAALRRGRAALKARIADLAPLDPATLPYSAEVAAEVQAARATGRAVWLVSAADQRWVDRVARHLGYFAGALGSDGATNLRGAAKAQALIARFGAGGFDYLGDHPVDIAVWGAARAVLIAHPTAAFRRRVSARFPHARAIGAAAPQRAYLAALRPHQWLKNLLVFAPILAAHRLAEAAWAATALAFVALCLVASALYLINDLLDLCRDRSHPAKRQRPLAAGRLPPDRALPLPPALLLGAAGVAVFLPVRAALTLALYAGGSLAYSLWLKRLVIADVVALACLYGSRLVLGAGAAATPLSGWLAAFALFLFFALALAKRMTELAQHRAPPILGRPYQVGDLPLLTALAAASAMVSVLVFALYVDSPDVRVLYHAPGRLWFVCVALLFWLGRILLLAHRGTLQADPLIFAATDVTSLLTVAVAAAILVAAL